MDDSRNVKLHITGTQVIDSEETVMDYFVEGRLELTGDGFCLEYTEPAEHQLSDRQTMLKYDGESVKMERDNGSSLLIQQGRRHVCQYATPFGNMYFGISGGPITIDNNGGKLDMEFAYTIDMNTRLASQNRMKISARPI